jgi:hypothetical protein
MARARTRHIIKRGIEVNDVDLTGQEVAEFGVSDWMGNVSKSKRDPDWKRSHLSVRLEDVKFVRQHKLPDRMLTISLTLKDRLLCSPEEWARNSI